jgi:hypothetical protein
MHKTILGNNEMAQVQHKTFYALQKGKQLFSSFQLGLDLVKMKKLGKKKSLIGNWEGLYLYVGYVDE